MRCERYGRIRRYARGRVPATGQRWRAVRCSRMPCRTCRLPHARSRRARYCSRASYAVGKLFPNERPIMTICSSNLEMKTFVISYFILFWGILLAANAWAFWIFSKAARKKIAEPKKRPWLVCNYSVYVRPTLGDLELRELHKKLCFRLRLLLLLLLATLPIGGLILNANC